MNVEIGTEAAQFPEKKYINWIFVAVQREQWPASSFKKKLTDNLLCFLLVYVEWRPSKCLKIKNVITKNSLLFDIRFLCWIYLHV
jgi:hypothetical protein